MGNAIGGAKRAGVVVWIALFGTPLAAGADTSPAADAPSPSTFRIARDAAAIHLIPLELQFMREGQLAQASPKPAVGQGGQTLQFGAPASPAPERGGESLKFGTPPSPVPAQAGESLQLGTPPPPQADAGLQIGGPAPPVAPTMAPAEAERVLSVSVPWVRAEAGWLPADNARANFSGYFSGALRAIIRPKGLQAWSLQGTIRADSYPQSGSYDDATTRLDFGESFVRYDDARTRITLGAQKVLWGRVDEIPPTDQMSVQDITRFALDELSERRRAAPALRIEHSFDALKLDAVLMPWFRPAELADEESIWYQIRQEDGRVLGIGNQAPLYNNAIRLGTIGKTDDFEDFGGAGVRMSRRGSDFDVAVTVQRTRRSVPHYQIDPAVRAAVLQGVPIAVAIANGRGPTFREVHPLTWVLGGDAAFEALGGTVRVEAAYLSDFPVTTLDGRLQTHDALDWVAGYEFFPGDGNTRVTLQLTGHQVFGTPTTLERTRIFALTGEVEVPFAQERWRFNTRWSLGLNDRDIYLNPKLSFVGWEPHELFVGAHLFSGSQRTANGFFEDNDLIVLGWRTQF